MTREEKIKVIAEHLTTDPEEIKVVSKEIDKTWFEAQINSAAFNILDNEGSGTINQE